MTRIKICGITNARDARDAVRCGADMLGFVFFRKSSRAVTVRIVREIVKVLPGRVKRVGVFVNARKETVRTVAKACRLDMVQFHGDEGPAYCAAFRKGLKVIKACRVRRTGDLEGLSRYDVDYYLLDSHRGATRGGTGKSFRWSLASKVRLRRPAILSGGLTPLNVARGIRTVSPYAVDVSSGVERRPGEKDVRLMQSFVRAVRKVKGHDTR